MIFDEYFDCKDCDYFLQFDDGDGYPTNNYCKLLDDWNDDGEIEPLDNCPYLYGFIQVV